MGTSRVKVHISIYIYNMQYMYVYVCIYIIYMTRRFQTYVGFNQKKAWGISSGDITGKKW